MMRRQKGIKKSARRRVRTRTALFLCIFSAAGMLLLGLMPPMLPQAVQVWLGALGTLLFFALPAYLGLCQVDGDQRHLPARRKLSGGQMLWLGACGVLLTCPATLLSDVVASLPAAFGFSISAVQGTGTAALLLPMLLVSGLLAPVCEEIFFRGYLLGAFGRYGEKEAAMMTAALFALSHGLSFQLPVYLLLGLLFASLALHTGAWFAPVIVHAAYNTMLILLSATPLSGLFAGLSPVSCMARLLGAACFGYALQRAWRARGVREAEENAALTKREIALLIAALVLVMAAQLIAGGMDV